MSGKKCKHCGSSEIEVDPARGDAVCTSCGTVLEDNIIVAEVEFQENAHGGSSAIGQFVSADSKGGATGFGRAFNVGSGQESREITLRRAREGITHLCQQLRMNQQCIDIACNFYKMALSLHLTTGRPVVHTQAACIYMTCRTEGTPHLLIDVSDAASMCCYQLGGTFFKLSRALCINIPPNDPCLYILRFASQLQFEDKQHEVSMTALRLVQRMKRDSIHSGRRPSGICGAALLIAARLHDFCRTPADVVRIVKVHESTLRKRLFEFGETPSSALTLDEFMTVDLEEEQDPPAFRAARKRDKERLQKLMEEEDGEKELTELQREIEAQLEKDSKRKLMRAASLASRRLEDIDDPDIEDVQAAEFANEDMLNIIGEITKTEGIVKDNLKMEKGLGPELAVIGLTTTDKTDDKDKFLKPDAKPGTTLTRDLINAEDLVLDEKDEEYVNSMIMTEKEAIHKTKMWNRINAGYLRDQKIKAEIRARDKEQNKSKKKTRGCYKKKVALNAATASEAVGKMLAERKISAKINYDILRSLDNPGTAAPSTPRPVETVIEPPKTPAPPTMSIPESPAPPTISIPESPAPKKRKKGNNTKSSTKPPTPASPANPATPATPATPAPPTPATPDVTDDFDEDMEPEVAETTELSLAAMLQNGEDEDYYDYEEY